LTWNYGGTLSYASIVTRFEDALSSQRRNRPVGHPDIAGSLFNICTVLNALDRHNEVLVGHEDAALPKHCCIAVNLARPS
jgi:hypothetical protein